MTKKIYQIGDEIDPELVIARSGYILLILSTAFSIIGILADNPLLYVPSLTIQSIFVLFLVSILFNKTSSFSLELTLPSVQIKAKQFLTLHLKIISDDDIHAAVNLNYSSGLFPVLRHTFGLLHSQSKKGATFVLYAPRRGKEKIQSIDVMMSGIHGWFYMQTTIPVNIEIVVLPQPQRVQLPWTLKQKIFEQFISEISINKRGQGDEFLSLRDFYYGDELRHIHWKKTAKMGKLITKEFEEPIQLRFLIVVDRSMLMAGPKLEFALSAIVELTSVIRQSNHYCTIIVHGDRSTWKYNLGTSPSSYAQLGIHLHLIKPEGSNFNFKTLRDYIIQNRLVDTVMIIISDLEKESSVISEGYTLLRPYFQRLIYFACYSPGFGTLVSNQLEDGVIIDANNFNYRKYVLEPKINWFYEDRIFAYRAILNRPYSKFHTIFHYNTNILLELQQTLNRMRQAANRIRFQVRL